MSSATHRTATFFRRHRRRWISALQLLRVGGALAWRTELSRCRTQFGMDIQWNKDIRRSKYRYVGRLRGEA